MGLLNDCVRPIGQCLHNLWRRIIRTCGRLTCFSLLTAVLFSFVVGLGTANDRFAFDARVCLSAAEKLPACHVFVRSQVRSSPLAVGFFTEEGDTMETDRYICKNMRLAHDSAPFSDEAGSKPPTCVFFGQGADELFWERGTLAGALGGAVLGFCILVFKVIQIFCEGIVLGQGGGAALGQGESEMEWIRRVERGERGGAKPYRDQTLNTGEESVQGVSETANV